MTKLELSQINPVINNVEVNQDVGRVRNLLDNCIQEPEIAPMGSILTKESIKSTIGPFLVLPEYKTLYPKTVTTALANLYTEYNNAFKPLVQTNQEWPSDYQHAITSEGTPINRWVQIDMVGLSSSFLKKAATIPEPVIREVLRGKIFEYENSLAMYQLLERIFEKKDSESTRFDSFFRSSLDTLRQQKKKPIALLAVTEQKYLAMKGSEFGKQPNEPLTDEEVYQLSGFDKFFSPSEFQEQIAENNGGCDYLLYVRSSDPVTKLRKPKTVVENPLLADDRMRQIIKAHAITFNIDNPQTPVGSEARINDTKAWMPLVGMGFQIKTVDDLRSQEFINYLTSQGIDLSEIESGKVKLRGKPMQASYGGYGHHHAELGNRKFLDDLKDGLKQRGPYIIQPELVTPILINETDGSRYTYIDRNFFSTDGQKWQFMGGFRSLMPLDTQEAERGRVHGNHSTVWAEIY